MKGLVLGGGGSKGAFVGGMLEYMKMVDKQEFDLYSGTSTGTLLQTLTSINEFDKLREVYTSITLDDIYKISPFKQGDDPENPKLNIMGMLKMHFIEKEPTFGDSRGLKELIHKFFPKEVYEETLKQGKNLITTVTNLDTASSEYYSSKDLGSDGYDEFVDWSWISSNAVPFTSLVKRGGNYYGDGGFAENLPIKRLIELGATDIVAISTKSTKFSPVNKDMGRDPLKLLARIIDVLLWESAERDIEVVKKMSLERDVRLTIINLPRNLTDNPMYFDKEIMTGWWDEGYEYAKILFNGHKNDLKHIQAKQCTTIYNFKKTRKVKKKKI